MLICKDCLSEDCNCVCTICNKHQPEINTPEKKLEERKKTKQTGLVVTGNLSRKWVHPICTGLTKKKI